MAAWTAQLRKGVLEMGVLASLARGEAYGYEILRRLADRDGQLAITESTLYPLLARLAKERLIEGRAASSPAGPPRRYYRLTDRGRARLSEMAKEWQALAHAINDLLEESP
jgi:PadR family transcriptional regulator PadR